jgi:hypothetical protein
MNEDINPEEEEIPYDGIDQDCNGEDLTDVDGDGFSPDDGDCDDMDEDINPEEEEIPYDGIDQDCNGEDLTDVDGDGFSPDDGDCDDENEDINPDAEEIPNDGIDQDCDGEDLVVGVESNAAASVTIYISGDVMKVVSPGSETRVRIFNSLGQILLEKNLTGPRNEIDIKNLPSGVYLVEYLLADNVRGLVRVLK